MKFSVPRTYLAEDLQTLTEAMFTKIQSDIFYWSNEIQVKLFQPRSILKSLCLLALIHE